MAGIEYVSGVRYDNARNGQKIESRRTKKPLATARRMRDEGGRRGRRGVERIGR